MNTAGKVVLNRGTCPRCKVDRNVLAECLSSQAYEDRSTACIIIENCVECKSAFKGALNG